MPSTQRRAQSGLIDRLIEQPSRFNFFQAVRLLDLWLRRGAPVHGKTLDSVLRFKNTVSLSFPPSQIEAVAVSTNSSDAGAQDGAAASSTLAQHRLRHIHLTPAFMGFLGVNGVLPYDYTATIAAQIAFEKNEAGRAFFDSFSQRSMLLFYRAWAKCRIECRGDADGRDSFLDMQLALAGRLHRHAQETPSAAAVAAKPDAILPDEVVARYAALIRHRPLQADMLAGVLTEYFGVPFRCQPLVGAWASHDARNRAVLGVQNHVLGAGMMLGPRYWRRDAIVRLWVGPLSRADFDRFIAGGSATKALKAMLSLFALPAVSFEIRPTLRAAEVRRATLGGHTRLCHGAVLFTAPRTSDHDGARYHIAFTPE